MDEDKIIFVPHFSSFHILHIYKFKANLDCDRNLDFITLFQKWLLLIASAVNGFLDSLTYFMESWP